MVGVFDSTKSRSSLFIIPCPIILICGAMFSPDSPKAPNLGRITMIFSWTFTGVAMLAVVLLLWSRRITKSTLGLDIYLTLIAFILSIALVVHVTWAILHEGLDKQVEQVPAKQRAMTVRVRASLMIRKLNNTNSFTKSLMANEVLWALTNALIRLSALSLIGRISKTARSALILTYLLMTLTTILGLVVPVVSLLICRPVTAAWDSEISGQCGNQIIAYVSLESSGALIDVAIMVFGPIMICRLQMAFLRKLVLSVVMSLGVL